ncbi:uncharacterized protein LOC141642788 [Silene latifolia]|uniref:uncharacterized protein LOC141642788 n=1 Tax=Silene latifolia TaxID=37657 RepID=UPI003D778228
MVPEANLPGSFREARKIVRDLGLDYKKIYACPNDCMLYWKEYENAEECRVCHVSKWKQCEGSQSNKSSKPIPRIPAKVLWHFPLKPRLERIYMCSEIAEYMTWHFDKRPKDGNLRHPADGLAWKQFDSLYPEFAKEPRNVRLGLASDGFSPFRTMSVSHSTWPVVLINYNLPPWMFMKHEYLMLSLLIPGPEGPGNNIDIYLQPLIDELKDLWNLGLETYDKKRNETFMLHASLCWTISDFPGYSMLSGWKTKGKFACPSCNHETDSLYLNHSKKMCYMDNRKFLDLQHPWRKNKKSFNGKVEERLPPKPLSGFDVFEEVSDFVNSFGKKQKKKKNDCPWKKKSIFFELPYWKVNACRHNLDVMHIEKNLCDNLLGTLLDIVGKTKDHAKARFDILELGIKEDLHPQLSDDQKHVYFQKACYSMCSKEKDIFCRVLKSAKMPHGFASNISRCVNSSQKKVSGYKSHDAHILLHYLIQVAARKSLPRHVAIPLIKLSTFFRKLYSKVLNPKELDHLQTEIVQILCEFEKIFLPSFFDIMVHLPIHLVDEVRLGGPVHGRGMFFIERYLCKLKSYVRNRGHPEGSIAEGYLIEECTRFCSRYMNDGMKTKCNNATFDMEVNEPDVCENHLFANDGKPLGGKKWRNGKLFTLDPKLSEQAHRYALFNSDSNEVDQYIKGHETFVNSLRRNNKWKRARSHCHEFASWLKEKATEENISDNIFWLAKGPSPTARRYKGYYANGYDFYTKSRDAQCKTQNSGVTLAAVTSSFASSRDQNPVEGEVIYYGAVLEIIELSYSSKFNVVLFRCEWYQVEKDEYGMTCINKNKFCSVDDPFVLPSQVHQVFYIADPIVDGLHYVMTKVPRDVFDHGDETISPNSYWNEPISNLVSGTVPDEDLILSRADIDPAIVDANTMLANVNDLCELNDDISDCDDTLWEWMEADEELNNEE